MPERTAVRQRITPSVPFILKVKDANKDAFEQSFQVAFDFNALCLVEKHLGINALTQFGKLLEEPSASAIVVLLWAGIQKNHPDFDGDEGLEVLGANLTLESAKPAFAACLEALLAQLPEEQAAKIRAAREGQPVKSDPLPTAPAL